MTDPDFTDIVLKWLHDTYEVTPETAMILEAGLSIGLELATRHPLYAAKVCGELYADYQRRTAGDEVLFQAMAVASGDERTSPEKMADEMVEACPLADLT